MNYKVGHNIIYKKSVKGKIMSVSNEYTVPVYAVSIGRIDVKNDFLVQAVESELELDLNEIND